MAGRRARTGRGWDAAPPRARRRSADAAPTEDDPHGTGSAPTYGGAAQADGSAAQAVSGAARADSDAAQAVSGAARAGGDRRRAAAVAPPVDPYEAAREICLRQLSFRPRTRAELATALRKRGIDDDVAATVLDRYDEVGLIDDAAFARAWVSSRHHGRGLARRALANELRQRGVDSEIADEALVDIDADTEATTARSLVDRKLRSMGSAPPDAVFRRLVSMLARKGYPAGVAIGAVKAALAERAASAEFADQLDVDALADTELGALD